MVKNSNEYMHTYYEKNKDKYLRKKICNYCNKEITISNFHKHLQKPVHLRNASKEGLTERLKAINKDINKLQEQEKKYKELLDIVTKIENEGENITEIIKMNKTIEQLKSLHCE